jgi:sulfopyruvate decarboxylase subunit alpha
LRDRFRETELPPGLSAAERVLGEMKNAHIDLVATLPDSWITVLLDLVDADPDIKHVPVAREVETVGICAGAWLGGSRPAAIMGTAGLLTCGHEFATLNLAHQIPMFVIAAKRGGIEDQLTYQVAQGIVGDDYLRAMQVAVVEAQPHAGHMREAYNYCRLLKRPLVYYLGRSAWHDEVSA